MRKPKKINIANKRSFKKLIQNIYFWFKVCIIISIIGAILINPIKNKIKDQLYFYTNELGFTLKNIIINGVVNSDIDSAYITSITGKKQIPLFSLDIHKIQDMLSKNSWVKASYAYLSLPTTLKIVIEEKKPIALWQHRGKTYIIDSEGDIITDKINNQYQFLPIIVGRDANINVQKLLNELSKSKDISEIITSCVYVGSRRWDLIIHDNLTIQMPEEHFSEAYKYLESIHQNGELANIKKLDLRDSKRYYRR
jgi:cell division protein FtsQ